MEEIIKINCTFEGEHFPQYQKDGDSAMDLHAFKCIKVVEHGFKNIDGELKFVEPELIEVKDFKENGYILNSLDRVLIPTGLKTELLNGVGANNKPRSGASLKYGLMAILGTIDGNYRGDNGIILVNLSKYPYHIKYGERLAQIEFTKPIKAELVRKDNINETNRGDKAFGSSGK